MTSKDIYTPIPPTYLYIKQHSITGLKYFGKTSQLDPYKYLGSGKYWTLHIKKHGKEHVETMWVSDLYQDTSIVEYALHFSLENNIVESNDWANLKHENGLDGGGVRGKSIQAWTPERKAKLSATNKTKNKGIPKPPFLSIIKTRKTYIKLSIDRHFPEFKQYY